MNRLLFTLLIFFSLSSLAFSQQEEKRDKKTLNEQKQDDKKVSKEKEAEKKDKCKKDPLNNSKTACKTD